MAPDTHVHYSVRPLLATGCLQMLLERSKDAKENA